MCFSFHIYTHWELNHIFEPHCDNDGDGGVFCHHFNVCARVFVCFLILHTGYTRLSPSSRCELTHQRKWWVVVRLLLLVQTSAELLSKCPFISDHLFVFFPSLQKLSVFSGPVLHLAQVWQLCHCLTWSQVSHTHTPHTHTHTCNPFVLIRMDSRLLSSATVTAVSVKSMLSWTVIKSVFLHQALKCHTAHMCQHLKDKYD